jgi:predicted negative regulator of RcsB-dependent stress response
MLTAALLFGVLRRAMREHPIPEDWSVVAGPIAGVVCTLWLLHPIQSEVVNYIVQRSESLASLCYLGTLYASQRAWNVAGFARLRWYAVAVVACAFGMASKEIVISAPLAVMLYDRAFRLPSWRALVRPGSGRGWLYLALWATCLATYAAFAAGGRGDTAGFHTDMPWYQYLYTQCWAIAHYLRLVVWPYHLVVDYGFNVVRGARGIPGIGLLAALGAATLVAWTRVPRYGWFAFLGSWFFMLLAPSSSVVPIASEVAAERRIYLALAAVLIVLVVSAEWIRRRLAPTLTPRGVRAGFGGLAIVLALVTAARSRTYGNPEALWRSAVQAVPDNPRALDNLGWALFRQRPPKFAQAESAFVRAIGEDSTCREKKVIAERPCSAAWARARVIGSVQFATVLAAEGRLADAERPLEDALARDPEYLPAERDLALVEMKLGEYERAIPHLERVVARLPNWDHLVALGVAYLSAGHREEAIDTFRATARLDSGSPAMQDFSRTLDAAARDSTALPALQRLALNLAREWM